jgi:hypothetical protein
VRHTAWLNASQRQREQDKARPGSRLSQLAQQGITEPEMPDCDARYLIDYLFEIGPTQGDAPLSHTELRAWQHNIGISLQAWELRFLKRLSVEYLGQYRDAAEPDCPSPWAEAPYAKLALSVVAKNMKAAITGMESL